MSNPINSNPSEVPVTIHTPGSEPSNSPMTKTNENAKEEASKKISESVYTALSSIQATDSENQTTTRSISSAVPETMKIKEQAISVFFNNMYDNNMVVGLPEVANLSQVNKSFNEEAENLPKFAIYSKTENEKIKKAIIDLSNPDIINLTNELSRSNIALEKIPKEGPIPSELILEAVEKKCPILLQTLLHAEIDMRALSPAIEYLNTQKPEAILFLPHRGAYKMLMEAQDKILSDNSPRSTPAPQVEKRESPDAFEKKN